VGLNHYELLGVPRDATTKQIEKAYRSLSKAFHPDAASPVTNSAIFREATEAKDTLVDPERRRKYDEQLDRGDGSQAASSDRPQSYREDVWRSPPPGGGSYERPWDAPVRPKKTRSPTLLVIALASLAVGRLLESFGTTLGFSPLNYVGGLLVSLGVVIGIAFFFVSRERADAILRRLVLRWAPKAKKFGDKTDSESRPHGEGDSSGDPPHSGDVASPSVNEDENPQRPLRQKKVVIPALAVVVVVATLGIVYSHDARAPEANASSTTTTTAALATLINPASNVIANPDFLSSGPCSKVDNGSRFHCTNPCFSLGRKTPLYTDSRACTSYVQTAVNDAREGEDIVPMNIPSNWVSLSPAEQLFVVINLERVGRGYPPYLGMNADLDARVIAQAKSGKPAETRVPGFKEVIEPKGTPSPWISHTFSAMEADFFLMYADGWSGSLTSQSNKQCTSATGKYCWFSRDVILGSDPRLPGLGVGLNCTDCEVGAAFAVRKDVSQWDFLVEAPSGVAPMTTFSWASETAYFAPGELP